jgi:hypothetical protein
MGTRSDFAGRFPAETVYVARCGIFTFRLTAGFFYKSGDISGTFPGNVGYVVDRWSLA